MQIRTTRVLHLVSNIRTSGAERLIGSINIGACSPTYESTVLAFGSDQGFGEVLRQSGYGIHCLNASARSFMGLFKFGIFLIKNPHEVIHLHVEQNFLAVCLLTRIICPQSRIVRTVHGLHEYQGLFRVRRIIWTQISVRLLRVKWTVVSKNVERIERKYIANRMQVIENWPTGIPANFEMVNLNHQSEENTLALKRKYLLLGNCDINKNHFEILNRYKNDSNVLILHLGDIAHMDSLEATLISSTNVQIIRGDSFHAISSADEVIVPSILEASSMVVLESLLLFKPVHVRSSWGAMYSEFCETSESSISEDFLKLVRPKDYAAFRKHYNKDRAISQYLAIYGRL